MPKSDSVQSHRKDEHISLAKKFFDAHATNDFDQIRFIHQSLPELSLNDVDIQSNFLDRLIPAPFFINAMTGGSQRSFQINQKLGRIAAMTGIPIASGSESVALREPKWRDSFQILRKENPDGLIIGNLSASKSIDEVEQAVEILNADAIQLHINAAQEVIMPEGHNDYHWLKNIKKIVHTLQVPVIVKEVGFGMSKETIDQLLKAGVTRIDISGTGGTNFAKIENERRKGHDFDYLSDWGLSTVESLLESSNHTPPYLIASGGIRNPLDILKSLRLGADLVGVSGKILNLLIEQKDVQLIAEELLDWQLQIQKICLLLGVKNLRELKVSPIVLSEKLINYATQRDINLNSILK